MVSAGQVATEALRDVDVIVPVLNEEKALSVLWERLQALPCVQRCHFVFVDNGSTDGSVDFLRKLGDISLIEHTCNQGYGGSLVSAFEKTTLPYVVVIDADCEYPPEVIPDLLRQLECSRVVYASRLLAKQNHRAAGMPFLKWFGNRCISAIFNVLFSQCCTDLYTGCKAFHRGVLTGVVLKRKGFEHVLEFAVMLSQQGIRITEQPVCFSPRMGGVSKMSHLLETIKFAYWLVYFRCGVRLIRKAAA